MKPGTKLICPRSTKLVRMLNEIQAPDIAYFRDHPEVIYRVRPPYGGEIRVMEQISQQEYGEIPFRLAPLARAAKEEGGRVRILALASFAGVMVCPCIEKGRPESTLLRLASLPYYLSPQEAAQHLRRELKLNEGILDHCPSCKTVFPRFAFVVRFATPPHFVCGTCALIRNLNEPAIEVVPLDSKLRIDAANPTSHHSREQYWIRYFDSYARAGLLARDLGLPVKTIWNLLKEGLQSLGLGSMLQTDPTSLAELEAQFLNLTHDRLAVIMKTVPTEAAAASAGKPVDELRQDPPEWDHD